MLFKYQSLLKISKYFTFHELQEGYYFLSSDLPAFKFLRLFVWLNWYIYVE